LSAGGFGASEVVVHINGLETPWGRDDLEVALSAKPDAVLVPKVSTPQDLVRVREITEGIIPLWVMMETPLAILSSLSIAQSRLGAVPELSAMVIGTNDLAKETRTVLTPGRASYLPWLMQCIAAARCGDWIS
jgi:citrate lyase subunit beta/citryl-CoA lyase